MSIKLSPVLWVSIAAAVVGLGVLAPVGIVRTLHGEPVPASMQALVGSWSTGGGSFRLDASGNLETHLKNEQSESSIHCAVRQYSAHELTCEVMFVKVRYAINAPPYAVADGSTHMAVDGLDYKKTVGEE